MLLLTSLLVLGGCSGDGNGGRPAGEDFISDNPDHTTPDPGGSGGSGNGGTGGSGGSGGSSAGGSGGGDPQREIEEADIIKLDGDRLYALSRYGGLSVIDVGEQDRLDFLGRYKTDAQPFEMYLRGNVVLGLFDSYGTYVQRGSSWEWVTTSRVLALDVSNPADIQVLGEVTLPGAISDSRIVGDVLYVVSHEDGYCWECASVPTTTVVSLDISQPGAMHQVDRLTFPDVSDSWGSVRRSITVTDQRMYIAGRDYDETWGSKIQIVDISDAAGDMRAGVAIRAEGEIESRWQMDEHAGVLRVLSQPGVWSTNEPPVLQTFAINSADNVNLLARLPLVLPRPERLRSVRFDGDRGYAITFEQTDPLFTFDLSDPSAPLQMGELEIPGWVYHMEPRGDRILALGYEPGNTDGSLHVSIFDVSDLSAPTQLSRVNFGGDWANLAEDQDRIHKAFGLLEPLGLILVPYSGYTYSDAGYYGCGTYSSGVQLIDWSEDTLVKRGIAPSVGESRRAFVHQDRLFTVSDDRVQTFDVSDRDQPQSTAHASLARRVSRVNKVGNHLVRLGANWWTETAELDVVPASDPSRPDSIGSLDLERLVGQGTCGYGFSEARLFNHGSLVYVAYNEYSYDNYYSTDTTSAVAVVDISNPAEPTLVAHHGIGTQSFGYWGGYGFNQVVSAGERVAQLGSVLAFLRAEAVWEDGAYTTRDASIELLDLTDPANPKQTRVQVPKAQGLTGLVAAGGALYTSHFEPLASDPNRVRFYLDRIDVSNPSAPRLSKVNVPGSLLSLDPASGKLITVDYTRHSERVEDSSECYTRHGYYAWYRSDQQVEDYYYYDGPGTCTWLTHRLHLVSVNGSVASLEATRALGEQERPQLVRMGDGVLFAQLDDGWSYSGPQRPTRLHMLSGFSAGRLDVAALDITPATGNGWYYLSHLAVSGKRAAYTLDNQLGVIDARSPTAPRVVSTEMLSTYPEDLVIDEARIYASMGYDGVVTRPLQ